MNPSLKQISALLLGGAGLALLLIGGPWRYPAPSRILQNPPLQLSGDAARRYLHEGGDGKALMEAVTATQFGLKAQEHSPFDAQSGAGYLAMSHDQNLNAWFSENGVTVRPTLPEAKRDQAWRIDLRLKAYGYGQELSDVPPVTTREVNGNRVEYLRQDQARAPGLSNRKSQIESRKLIEWYENRAEGIEQGFTVNEPPQRRDAVAPSEPLRVLLAVAGDLSARMTDREEIRFEDKHGQGALSYGKLVAVDADGKKLRARMNASADGREIALVVEDAGARYPIVIDPIMASFEKEFDGTQTDSRFGFAVAIQGNTAVVGAWRTDVSVPGTPYSAVDAGLVYVFRRSSSDSSWSLLKNLNGFQDTNDTCGWSVAIDGATVVFGCRGASNLTGAAFLYDISYGVTKVLAAAERSPGDQFGYSIAIDGSDIVVGEPFRTGRNNEAQSGVVQRFRYDSSSQQVTALGLVLENPGFTTNRQMGISVAIEGNIVLAGGPGGNSGKGEVVVADVSIGGAFSLTASDGEAGDNFGESVALSHNTAVIGAYGDDDRGTDAGAAYVFVRNASGQWSQQQKLTSTSSRANDHFSQHAVAIEGNTIVVGADEWDFLADDNAGAVYIFTRDGTVWTQQTELKGGSAYNYGIGVDISGNSVIIGARGADAPGLARAGTAYVYRLDCVPPYDGRTTVTNDKGLPQSTFCPGDSVFFYGGHSGDTGSAVTYQWRRNGVNIPGATSFNYYIGSATASDGGSYDRVTANSCGSDISQATTIVIHSFSLNPTSQNFGVSGSNGIVNIASTGNCSWTAVSSASFITVTSGGSGTGNGTVGFTVAANPSSGQRTGTITIAGLTFNVSQDGTNCAYSIAPTSQTLGASASTNTVNVTAGAGCAWIATSNDPSFLSINSGASGTGNGTVTYTIAANSATTQRIGSLTIAGQTFTVTQAGGGPTVLGNISTRLRVETGDNALIGGFIVTGTQPKKVIVRAIGPSLPFADKLGNPTLELHGPNGLIEANDNWVDSPNKQAIIDSTVPPGNDLESAIVATLPANSSAYTAVVRGGNDTTGIGVVEVYDLDRSVDSKLANISTRGLVQTGDNVLIAGTIVLGQTPQKVIIRAIGPSLPIAGRLADPTLELRNANGNLIRANDNWRTGGQEAEIIASTVPPPNDFEAAIVESLPSNGASYTAIVRGVSNTTGIAVVEVYALP